MRSLFQMRDDADVKTVHSQLTQYGFDPNEAGKMIGIFHLFA